MNFTFRQLKAFEAVARHLSYTRASEELHLTQPAVSMQIRQLEEHVGLPLFEQIGKRIHLTDAGRELYHYSCAIAAQVSELEMVLEEMKGLRRGHLTIAVASTANYFVPRLIAAFCQRHQGVSVTLEVTNREALLNLLAINAMDLAIMGQPASSDPVAHPFMENPLVIIAPPDHPLAGEKGIPLQRLAGEGFVVREKGSGTRASTERFFAEHGVAIRATQQMHSSEAIKQAVEAGLGLGVLSLHTLEMELALNRLVILDVEGFPIRRHWYLVHPRGKRFSKVGEAFLNFTLEEARHVLHLPTLPRS
ncbi:DNA-binding transcriptional regulator, LysR family [Ectothiorhodospira mobilis]|uniref:DNA-binding transcriptional regulator, LysR family n=1 Tax=Ectothiorhodospira mobilis TaxID=195064 RepID=A0A1I4RTA0_ECTMO|nr:LysR family transcriptional regulator [Ectothiorhodospira mobilis]SFM55456.1 DNA-binding transcriptional regulator, LysR family [Ectothiorhodospira mobilis]